MGNQGNLYNSNIRFTKHAIDKIYERTSLNPGIVTGILKNNTDICVGSRNNKVHRLFYSMSDNECFVAIQDINNGDIITVITLDYHQEWAWPVAKNAQDLAKMKAFGEPLPEVNVDGILNIIKGKPKQPKPIEKENNTPIKPAVPKEVQFFLLYKQSEKVTSCNRLLLYKGRCCFDPITAVDNKEYRSSKLVQNEIMTIFNDNKQTMRDKITADIMRYELILIIATYSKKTCVAGLMFKSFKPEQLLND